MKPGMKLLAMETMRRSNDTSRPRMDGDYTRMSMAREYDRMGGEYDRTGAEYDRMDNRRMGRNTRMDGNVRIDMNDRYDRAEMAYEGVEDRFRDRQGRERYNNGRYALQSRRRYYETRNEMEEPMDTIGFNTDMIYNAMDEPRREDRAMRGAGTGAGIEFSRETAMEWTKAMENSDGSKGAHWTPEQTKQQMNQVGFHGSPDEFYAIMNSIYSDYSAVIKRYGVDRADFYAHLAKAWLEDKDAVEDKAMVYYECVVKH